MGRIQPVSGGVQVVQYMDQPGSILSFSCNSCLMTGNVFVILQPDAAYNDTKRRAVPVA